MAGWLKSREALLAAAIAVLVALIAARFPAFIRPANLANVPVLDRKSVV